VQIRRRLERGGVEFVVVHQPDGSFACLPAWMMQPAASRFEIGTEPHFSVDILRALRREIDALLGFLSAESKPGEADHDASTRGSTKPVRRKATAPYAAAGAEGRTGRGRERPTARDRSSTRKTDKNGDRS
jgi:hypothetical protein